MLYLYNGKVYVKPFDHKMVEVNVSKNGKEYNVKATEKWIMLDSNIKSNLYSITVEEAYKMQNEAKSSKNFDLE